MLKMNNRGFTLVEVLAVLVILSILIAIMVPTVNSMIKKNKEDNYNQLEESIVTAAKIYVSDNRYDIILEGSCISDTTELNVVSIKGKGLEVSKLSVETLVDAGNMKTNRTGDIVDPRDRNKILNQGSSYVKIQYSCSKKDFVFDLEDLEWK